MRYQFFDTPDFIKELRSEQSVFIFSANLEEFTTLSDFGFACADKVYKWEVEYQRKFLEKYGSFGYHPFEERFPWEKWKEDEQFIQYPLTLNTFYYKQKFCIEGLRKPLPNISENRFKSAMVLKDEWHSVFIVAELDDSFVGYWWRTSA